MYIAGIISLAFGTIDNLTWSQSFGRGVGFIMLLFSLFAFVPHLHASFLYICSQSVWCLNIQVQDGVVTYKGTFACMLSQKPSILCTLSYIRVVWQSWQIFLYILKKSTQEVRIHGSLFDKYLKIKRWMKSTSHFIYTQEYPTKKIVFMDRWSFFDKRVLIKPKSKSSWTIMTQNFLLKIVSVKLHVRSPWNKLPWSLVHLFANEQVTNAHCTFWYVIIQACRTMIHCATNYPPKFNINVFTATKYPFCKP